MTVTESLTGLLSVLLLCLIAIVPACGPKVTIKHQPVQFSDVTSPYGKGQFPNWPVPPDQVEGELYGLGVTGQYEAEEIKRTATGTSGAFKAKIYFPTLQKEVTFKGKKAIPGDLDSWNNSPRREIAAYQIQKLFLEPEDYVVPTSFMLSIPRDIYEKNHGYTLASVEGTSCVLVFGSLWLKNVTVPGQLYEESRFLQEPNYAYFMSNLNVFTYLVAHRDAKPGNFLVSKDEVRRQVFAVDNGTTFGIFPYNFFVQNWNVLRVPALRKDSIDRLRQVQRQDLDFLGVLVQFEKDEKGILMPVPAGDNLDPTRSVRIQDGTVQLGLRRSEINGVWQRIQTLIADVDSGKIPVF